MPYRTLFLLLLTAAPLAAQDVAFVPLTAPYRDCAPQDTLQDVCRVRTPWRAAALRDRIRRGTTWTRGDTLTVAYAGAARRVRLCCTTLMPMSPVGSGDSLWVVSVRVPALARGRFDLRVQLNDSLLTDPVPWHGAAVRPPVAPSRRLSGHLLEDTMTSKVLGTPRGFTVYLPPWGNATRRPVVYLADGLFVRWFAPIVDTLIRSGRLAPVALVGVHHATAPERPTMEDDPRFFEYLAMGRPRYAAHERFFTEEVAPWAEARYGLSTAPADRALWGVSNSGYFVLNMGVRHPALWGHILGFSPAGDKPELGAARRGAAAPVFHVVWGSLEPGRLPAFATQWERDLGTAGFTVRRSEYVGGHELTGWKEEFADVLIEVFGRGTSPRR